jgi:hypothetical protein
VPEIDHRARDRIAPAREHKADQLDLPRLRTGLDQIVAAGRAGAEERTFGLRRRGGAFGAALRRDRKLLCGNLRTADPDAADGKRAAEDGAAGRTI